MKKSFNIIRKAAMALLLSVCVFPLASCGDDTPDYEPETAEQTIIMYFPWAGGGSIYSCIKDNISAFEGAVKDNNGLDGRRIMVFISQNSNQSCLINIDYKNGKCVRDTLKYYDFGAPDYTTPAGITDILNDIKQVAPANAYSMIIGAHGLGWLPKNSNTARRMAVYKNIVAPMLQTRYFGNPSSTAYQTDVTDLAAGIKGAGLKMKYILFDDCYMSNIETTYDLKDATDFLIASTSEVMLEGFPYGVIGKAALHNDYKGICDGFYNYYSNHQSSPYGTIGITDCSKVEEMAVIMKQINTQYPDGVSSIGSIQKLDGYYPAIFYDFGDYVDKLCEDENLKQAFNNCMDRLVPYKAHTDEYYTDLLMGGHTFRIETYSGITVSDPSVNTEFGVKTSKTTTAWYKATH